ncbi:MAG: carbon storage regulator [Planctomycetia bacterium]|nr:carbon storage regulator [Planctomycetia bacterium]
MLVLTRKLNESVYIDGDIEVMIVAVRGNKVRLGFRAPADVSIQRKERALAIDHPHGDFHTDDERPEDDLVALHFGRPRVHAHSR